ncbi:L-fucose:H+ symporter permease [Granulicella sp. S190]|uniref:L-fucose:H+ symporter permease n=1 Tax=Granulicella sp. S190 TaxID=1747226 RepID=UPI00131B6628|nr:L-fucose:H+ symporter permease [Granulicella sp. S190]
MLPVPTQSAKYSDTQSVEGQTSGSSLPLIRAGNTTPFVLVSSLFFLWGIPNNLNDVLIRQFMKSFTITRFEAGLVQSAFYMGYFLLAIPAAMLMRRVGYKIGMIVGLLLFGIGTFLFWPAAAVGQYSFFLFALFVIASGLAFLETASNPFITQLGDPSSSERRLNLAQAFNPLGAITGVLIGTIFIFSGVEMSPAAVALSKAQHTYEAYLRYETLRVVKPYLALGGIAFALAMILMCTKFPAISNEHEAETSSENRGRLSDLLHNPRFMISVAVQFLYVGAQVGTWSYFIQYVETYAHQTEKLAGFFLTGTLVAFALGRFSSAWLMQRIAPQTLMGYYSVANIVLVAVAIFFPGWVGLFAMFFTSFFMSIMFPTIFALGLKGLGSNTKIGGSLLVMAIVGGAVLTPLMGLISEWGHSVAMAYIVPLVSYVCVAAFSFSIATVRAGKNDLVRA